MSQLTVPVLHASPFVLLRAGLRWLRGAGDRVQAREPIAFTNVGIRTPNGLERSPPFPEEASDLQVVFAPSAGGTLRPDTSLSRGGFQDVVSLLQWDDGASIGALDDADGAELLPLVLVGRRGLDVGEGRGGLLSGWHDRTRAFWGITGAGRPGSVLSLGICEQTPLFRGENFDYMEWFARAPGPAQIISIPDERTVHSSAVLLQQLQRTPTEAAAIAQAVHGWLGEHLLDSAAFPAFEPSGVARGGRWPEGQGLLFVMNLLNEALGTSPLLERTDLLSSTGCIESAAPDAVALSLGAELTTHYRHRKTGWLIALHDYRLASFVGPSVRGWLKRDFERVERSLDQISADLAALAEELAKRTGGVLIVQNLISTTLDDRIPNYAWLGDAFANSVPVVCAEANSMLSDLTASHDISVLDSDALAAEYGVRHCPDRAHPDRVLLEAQRSETQRILRERRIPGF